MLKVYQWVPGSQMCNGNIVNQKLIFYISFYFQYKKVFIDFSGCFSGLWPIWLLPDKEPSRFLSDSLLFCDVLGSSARSSTLSLLWPSHAQPLLAVPVLPLNERIFILPCFKGPFWITLPTPPQFARMPHLVPPVYTGHTCYLVSKCWAVCEMSCQESGMHCGQTQPGP